MRKEDQKQQAKRVYVGLSGGVDSSVSAALLKDQGYDVTGVFIKVWQPPFLECGWPQDRQDAMRVAGHLGIPFTTIDLEDTYKRGVVDYMIEEYKRGRTPNPDVMCNFHVKFGAFFEWAMEEGADFVATGHYGRKLEIRNSKSESLIYQLVQGVDEKKDQTYFLWTLGQKQLSKTLFPVGEYQKPKVRELARKYELPVAEKKDSQGVCFLGKLDMKEFLSHYIDVTEGDVLNTDGEVIGMHQGAIFYTRGERRGFDVTKKSTNQPPMYVVDKDVEANTITVAPQEMVEENYRVNSIVLENVNWISGETPNAGTYQCRFRHQQPLRECQLSFENGATVITFTEPQTAVAEGQSLVVYDGEVCVGGGIIRLARSL